MISVTIAELKEILAQHQLWLTSEDGKRADLRGADLRGIGAQLRLMALADGSEKRLKLTPREGGRE